jgi:hypothetical protein
MICSKCKSELSLDGQDRIIPCKECLEQEHGEGFSEGYDDGRDENMENLVNSAYKKGYADCHMELTKEWISEWQLNFAVERADLTLLGDE